MKEIIFRGKRKDSGEWVYGDLMQNHDGRIFVGELVVNDYVGSACDRYELGEAIIEVESTSVGQFINSVDRNGQKMFEGDIVKVFTNKGNDMDYCVAIIIDNHSLIEDGYGRWFPQDTIRVEVVGNIFDNPELLTERSERWVEHYWDWPEGVYDEKWAY